MITQKINKLLTGVSVLSLIGMAVTAYLTYMHFKPDASDFCNFGAQFNCDIVNKSQWSYIDLGFVEIPVALLGFLTYTLFFVCSILVIKNWRFQKINMWLRPGNVLKLLRWLSVIGFIFSLYLTYVEAFILQTWCIFCLTQQFLILFIMILFFVMKGVINKNKKEAKVCEFC